MKKIQSALIRSLIIGLLPTVLWAGPVNINTADVGQLASELNGVGLEKAKAIVEYRNKNGKFQTASDLTKVKGVGTRIVEQNKGNIIIRDTDGKAASKPKT